MAADQHLPDALYSRLIEALASLDRDPSHSMAPADRIYIVLGDVRTIRSASCRNIGMEHAA